MFKIGDKVKFKDEKGEGIVSRIDDKYVFVTIEEGFEIPFKPEQLILINIENENNRKSEHIRVNVDENNKCIEEKYLANLTEEVYVAITIESATTTTVEKVILNLVNDTSDFILYCVFIIQDGEIKYLDSDKLEPATTISITEFDKSAFIRIEKILLQFIKYNDSRNEKGLLIEKELEIKGFTLIDPKSYILNDFFSQKAVIFPILGIKEKETMLQVAEKMGKDLDEIKDDSEENKKEQLKASEKRGIVEVDLHIEALLNDYKNLSPYQILNIQLAHFRKKMEECIDDKNVKRVVFIHGVGNGTLKLEICKILQKEYAHYDYQDAPYSEYGEGATMVILRK
ncbi:MAG: DUF2027 domain-containing protein [Bacteroidales bacterium]|nr:DUF2027 domain-containing protein [Bacteroidales bacterium]